MLRKIKVVALGLLLLLMGCSDARSTDNGVARYALLADSNFVLKVNRTLETPNTQMRPDNLQENDYSKINDGSQYQVTLSDDGQIVTIEPGSMRGHRVNNGDESKLYELDEGVFAGGRFLVWIHEDRFEAELTIYGSGVPIVKSERGYLILEQ